MEKEERIHRKEGRKEGTNGRTIYQLDREEMEGGRSGGMKRM